MKFFILIVFFFISSCSNNIQQTKSWKYSDTHLTTECFVYSFYSGDNYELFYEKYFSIENVNWSSPELIDFHRNIGNYLGKEVPLEDIIETGWNDPKQISLTTYLNTCGSEQPSTHIKNDLSQYFSYEVVRELSTNYCEVLAPNIKDDCLALQLIKYKYRLGSMGTKEQSNIYAIYKLKNEQVVILPLRNFYTTVDAENYISEIKL